MGLTDTGFPGGSAAKNLPANEGDPDLTPRVRKTPWGRTWQPLQHPCWEIPWSEEPGGLQSMRSQRVQT